MNLLGHVIVFVNLYLVSAYHQSISDGNIVQLGIQAGRVQDLAKVVRNLREYNFEEFKTNDFNTVGNVGKYLSKNLLNYMRYGYGNPRQEGLIITAHFSNDLPPLTMRDESLAVLIQRKDLDKELKNGILQHILRLDEAERRSNT